MSGKLSKLSRSFSFTASQPADRPQFGDNVWRRYFRKRSGADVASRRTRLHIGAVLTALWAAIFGV